MEPFIPQESPWKERARWDRCEELVGTFHGKPGFGPRFGSFFPEPFVFFFVFRRVRAIDFPVSVKIADAA
jgi:hypothetical protein